MKKKNNLFFKNLILILSIFIFFKIKSKNKSFVEGKVQLIIGCVPKNIDKNKEKIKIPIYYKGNSLSKIFCSTLGCQINIEENSLINYIFIAVSESIDMIPFDDETFAIKGLKSSDLSKTDFYSLSLSIIKCNNGTVSYEWEIKKINPPKRCFPENTIIIQANPKSIEIAGFEKDFFPVYPTIIDANKTFLGILFLPTLIIDTEKIKTSNNECLFKSQDISTFHS
jgi:hypothetical protein